MRRVMGVSVVPVLWKGMLQWCHNCRREHAYWWHNPHSSTLRLPSKILIKPSEPSHSFCGVTFLFTHQHHRTHVFALQSIILGEHRANEENKRMKGNKQEAPQMGEKQHNCLTRFLTVNICRSGKTTSWREMLILNPNVLQVGGRLLVSIKSFCKKAGEAVRDWLKQRVKNRSDKDGISTPLSPSMASSPTTDGCYIAVTKPVPSFRPSWILNTIFFRTLFVM